MTRGGATPRFSTRPADRIRTNVRQVLAALLVICHPAWVCSVKAELIMVPQAALFVTDRFGPHTPGSFMMPIVKESVRQLFVDLDRHVRQKAWSKAFATLADIRSRDPEGLLPVGDDLAVAASKYLWTMLVRLPHDGRAAFRIFNDARARTLLEAAGASPADETAKLREVFEELFITSVGDEAADRLGDTYFEAGDFHRAAHCWQTVLDHHPDTDLSVLRLHVKRAVALARLGDWAWFDRVLMTVTSGFGEDRVRVGGRDVVAAKFLATLGADRKAEPRRISDLRARLPLPNGNTPSWKFEFLGDTDRKKLTKLFAKYGLDGDFEPPVAMTVHGQRIYVNWMGVTRALDGRTGKLLWCHEKISKVTSQGRGLVQSGLQDQTSLTVAGGRVLVATPDLDSIPFIRLSSFDARSGKQQWFTGDNELNEFTFSIHPLVVGDTIYAVARRLQNSNMVLVAVDLHSGAGRWNLSLGSARNPNPNSRLVQNRAPPARLVRDGEMLYVLFNSGALAAVDRVRKQINWMYLYERDRTYMTMSAVVGPVVWRGRRGGRGWMAAAARGAYRPEPGAALDGGILYFKSGDARAVYGIHVVSRRLVSKHDLNLTDALLAVHGGRMYVQGENLTAIDLRSGEPVWWSEHVSRGAGRAVLARDRIYVDTDNGLLEFDKKGGKVMRLVELGDAESAGGHLAWTSTHLIRAKGSTVTAFTLPSAIDEK